MYYPLGKNSEKPYTGWHPVPPVRPRVNGRLRFDRSIVAVKQSSIVGQIVSSPVVLS